MSSIGAVCYCHQENQRRRKRETHVDVNIDCGGGGPDQEPFEIDDVTVLPPLRPQQVREVWNVMTCHPHMIMLCYEFFFQYT